MYLNICITFLLAGLAIVQAFPTENLEKSLEAENLEQENPSENKDRPRKSTICVSVKDQPQVQAVSLIPQHLRFQNVPEAVSALSLQSVVPAVQSFSVETQPLQTVNIQQIVPLAQTFSMQTGPHSAQIQSVSKEQHQLAKIDNQITPPVKSEASQTSGNANKYAPESRETMSEEPVEVFEEIHVDEPERIVLPHIEEEELVHVVPLIPVHEKRMHMTHPRSMVMVAETEPMVAAVNMPHCHICEGKCVHSYNPALRMMDPYHVDHVHLV